VSDVQNYAAGWGWVETSVVELTFVTWTREAADASTRPNFTTNIVMAFHPTIPFWTLVISKQECKTFQYAS
jgi:hypothetical protein